MAKRKRSVKQQHEAAPEHTAPALPAPLSPRERRLHWALVPLLLAITAALAISSLLGDSITFDETSHLTAGMSYLKHHDYRFAPDHPPLGKIWAAWPLLLMEQAWPSPDTPSWEACTMYVFGQQWLFGLNPPDRLLNVARGMVVVLLVGTCLAIYALGRSLLGPRAGLLALLLAAFSPTLLAHGRLVTTDLPLTFCAVLTLLTFGRLMQRITWPRLLAAAAALAALSLAKFSWPIVLVGLAAMALAALVRTTPIEAVLPWRRGDARNLLLVSRLQRLLAIGAVCATLALTTWIGIWTCYGWRYGMLSTEPPPPAGYGGSGQLRARLDAAWEKKLAAADQPNGPGAARLALTAWARAWHLLPEAYLYGFTIALESTTGRESFLMGEYAQSGRASYFPIAFAIKTPVAIMLLLIAALVAFVRHRAPPLRDSVLLVGVLTFGVIYALTAVFSNINIGHRHILPLYPLLFILSGAAVGWLTVRPMRWVLGAALAWLIAANLWIYPHYLSYFNELVGGPSRGHLWLADSNIDWGQDLKRLAEYVRSRPDERVQLAYFGSGVPEVYGINHAALPSLWKLAAPAADLTAGTYVISVTQLYGIYDFGVRDTYWALEKPAADYARLHGLSDVQLPPNAPEEVHERRRQVLRHYEDLRRKRLLNRLQHRPPDDRIGYSLFVYHLTDEDIATLTRP